MTRTGKIARLPSNIRDQINRRLQNGEQGKSLVQWLNSLSEVQAIVKAEFHGRPIRAQNISEWKKGGFREWQLQQDALEQVPLVITEAAELKGKVNGQLTDHLAVWLTAHLMSAVRRLAAADLTDAARWKLLHEACADLVALRRGDQDREWISVERERLQYLKDDLLNRYKKRLLVGLEAMTNCVEHAHPQAKDAWNVFLEQVRRHDFQYATACIDQKIPPTSGRSESIRPNPS
jgi:hypothetical protein